MQEAEVVALPRIIMKRWPEAGIDVLVNNAGLGRDNAALCSGSTASWVEMVSTNILGLCMCTRETVQVCRECCILVVHARLSCVFQAAHVFLQDWTLGAG